MHQSWASQGLWAQGDSELATNRIVSTRSGAILSRGLLM